MTTELTRSQSIDSIPEVDFIKQTFADLNLQNDDDDEVCIYYYYILIIIII